MNYQLPEVYEPKNAADLRRHYAAVFRRNRPETQRPIVVIKPVSVSYTLEQARQYMAEAHAAFNGEDLAGRNTMAEILAAVSKASGISESEIKSTSRQHRKARARNIFYYLCRQRTGWSMSRIGLFIGGRDHSTVLSGTNRSAEYANAFSPYRTIIRDAIAILEGTDT